MEYAKPDAVCLVYKLKVSHGTEHDEKIGFFMLFQLAVKGSPIKIQSSRGCSFRLAAFTVNLHGKGKAE
ncbi:hypothetical protein C9I98_08410 [Photobacterium sanctipauli]|uniref:Uncharacterized protein n=1 Tax=Photobacterium sanctipauli TaxID=1342794 RepID=A0A2T3NXC3_9GAMM|nr:hypothetical protein C9I98_08410 [Photobacterium sanctipauli]